MPASVLPATGTQAGSGAYGAVPTVPDPYGSQVSAIQGNTNILSALLGLSTGMGAASAAGANQQLIANLPDYQAMTSQASANILSDLAGQISPDVMALLNQQAAERGVSFDPSSPATNAAALRAMGLTSMGLQAQGQQELTSAIARTPTGPQFNPSTMLVTPEQQQEWQYLANELAAAPNPTQKAQAEQAALLAAIKAGAAGGGAGGAATGLPAALTSTQTAPAGAGGGTQLGGGATGTTAAGTAAWSPGSALQYNLPATTTARGVSPIDYQLGPVDIATARGAGGVLDPATLGIDPLTGAATGTSGLTNPIYSQLFPSVSQTLGLGSLGTAGGAGLTYGQPTTTTGAGAGMTAEEWNQYINDITLGAGVEAGATSAGGGGGLSYAAPVSTTTSTAGMTDEEWGQYIDDITYGGGD